MPAATGATSMTNLRFGRNHNFVRATDELDVVTIRIPIGARRLNGLFISRLDVPPVHP
jgi:hypothetical protein